MMEIEKNKSLNFDVNTVGKEPSTPQPHIGKGSMKDRYHIHGFFKEEQRRGFVVCHELDKHVQTIVELQDVYETFLASYNPRFCYGLSIGIVEESTLVE